MTKLMKVCNGNKQRLLKMYVEALKLWILQSQKTLI